MTGKGAGAISTIEIFGDSAQSVLRDIFKPVGTKPVTPQTGRILLGTIADGGNVIDQVTVGCEGPDSFAIHSHGNPLIVEMIMELLRKHRANLLTAQELLAKTLAAQGSSNTISIEAKLAQMRARTIQGSRMIAHQGRAGLAETAREWLDNIDEICLDRIRAQAARILDNSQAARLVMYGCTVVLTGPPNSGKSTLLNCLAGRPKAIVTDVKGTTRDWVEAECRMGPLSMTLIDTAGLDPGFLASRPGVEQTARKKTAEILERADLVLLILDSSEPTDDLGNELLDRISGKQVITVLNKSDLPAKLDTSRLPKFLSEPLRISAKKGLGMDRLTDRILQESGTVDFDLTQPTCFTQRQEELLSQVTNAESKRRAASIISDLVNGRV